jgi:hypothetical protein
MKHFMKYGIDPSFQNYTGYLAAFLKANIRTTFTYPKTVWYSLRYNAGEKFILHSNILYPYKYDLENTHSQNKEPVRLSTSLITNIFEHQIQQFKNYNLNIEKNSKKLNSNFDQDFEELYKIFKYNIENEKFDVPVAVPARVLYAIANYDKITKNSKIEFEKETLEFIVKQFLKKVEYADSDSISQILFAMYKLNMTENADSWNKILEVLNEKNFDVEFTHVSPSFPHLFRYNELEEGKRKNSSVNDLGNKLFLLGYKSVFEAYYAIKNASQNNEEIKANVIINNFKEKFSELKKEYYEYVKYL